MGSNNANDKIGDDKDGDDLPMIEDKLLKKKLLIDAITEKCASSSHEHELLQQINHAITSSVMSSGDRSSSSSKLEAEVISGGYTNYSYKVFVDDHPELCVFAKLCFEFALW